VAGTHRAAYTLRPDVLRFGGPWGLRWQLRGEVAPPQVPGECAVGASSDQG